MRRKNVFANQDLEFYAGHTDIMRRKDVFCNPFGAKTLFLHPCVAESTNKVHVATASAFDSTRARRTLILRNTTKTVFVALKSAHADGDDSMRCGQMMPFSSLRAYFLYPNARPLLLLKCVNPQARNSGL